MSSARLRNDGDEHQATEPADKVGPVTRALVVPLVPIVVVWEALKALLGAVRASWKRLVVATRYVRAVLDAIRAAASVVLQIVVQITRRLYLPVRIAVRQGFALALLVWRMGSAALRKPLLLVRRVAQVAVSVLRRTARGASGLVRRILAPIRGIVRLVLRVWRRIGSAIGAVARIALRVTRSVFAPIRAALQAIRMLVRTLLRTVRSSILLVHRPAVWMGRLIVGIGNRILRPVLFVTRLIASTVRRALGVTFRAIQRVSLGIRRIARGIARPFLLAAAVTARLFGYTTRMTFGVVRRVAAFGSEAVRPARRTVRWVARSAGLLTHRISRSAAMITSRMKQNTARISSRIDRARSFARRTRSATRETILGLRREVWRRKQ